MATGGQLSNSTMLPANGWPVPTGSLFICRSDRGIDIIAVLDGSGQAFSYSVEQLNVLSYRIVLI
jgi:hypothetical protein